MPREMEVCALCSEMGTLVSVAYFPLLASLGTNWNVQSTRWQFLLGGQQALVLICLLPFPALPTALSVVFLGPSFGLPDKG